MPFGTASLAKVGTLGIAKTLRQLLVNKISIYRCGSLLQDALKQCETFNATFNDMKSDNECMGIFKNDMLKTINSTQSMIDKELIPKFKELVEIDHNLFVYRNKYQNFINFVGSWCNSLKDAPGFKDIIPSFEFEDGKNPWSIYFTWKCDYFYIEHMIEMATGFDGKVTSKGNYTYMITVNV